MFYLDKNFMEKTINHLEIEKKKITEKESVLYSYINRKGYEICQQNLKQRIALCKEKEKYIEYALYIISSLYAENFDTLDTLKKNKCVKVKDASQLCLGDL